MNFKTINLKKNTSMQIGPVVEYVEIESGLGHEKNQFKKLEEELIEISKYAKSKKLKIHVLGEGTNSYFADNLKKYLFIKLNLPKELKFAPDPRAREHSGQRQSGYKATGDANFNWDTFVKETFKKNLWGLENLSYIPGSVGAAPVQNIGAYGVEVKDTLEKVKVFDTVKNKIIFLSNKECKFSYRNSIFKLRKNRYIILSVTFKLSKIPKPILTYSPLNKLDSKKTTLKEISSLVIKTRKEKLPDYREFPNSGSFFKNPRVSKTQLKKLKAKFPNLVFFKEEQTGKTVYKIAIAWFIEHVAKMKGVQIGNFGTHKYHALVLINYGKCGTAEELNKFIKILTDKIYKETGLHLEQEVNFIQ